MDFDIAISRVYDRLESDDMESAVYTCLRVARHLKDHLNSLLFLHELSPDKSQLHITFFEDTTGLDAASRETIWKRALNDWIDSRTLEFSLVESEPKRNLLTSAVGEINPEIERLTQLISSKVTPPGMSEYDTAYFTDRNDHVAGQARLKITALQTVKSRIKTRCFNYAVSIEKQLASQTRSETFLFAVQTEVNNYFRVECPQAYKKLVRGTQLLGTESSEDPALQLTTVRRAMNAVADHFYPPMEGVTTCADGQQRKLGREQYLNRLQEFVRKVSADGSSSDKLLLAEADYLATVFRKLNDVASKGVHGEVESTEAKQGLVSLYLFLANLLSKLGARSDN